MKDTGTVKWFNEGKGFGFITPSEGDKDVFVHIKNVKSGHLSEGQEVEFDTQEGRKGDEAVNVTSV